MSKRGKKYKTKKPLSPIEQERRRILRQKRIKRKSLKRKKILIHILGYISIAIFIIVSISGIIVFDVFNDTNYANYYFLILIGIGILLFDNSGIRSFIFKKLPDRFPFEYIGRPDKGQCRTIEFCKTLSYYSLLMYLILIDLSALWTGIWLVCEAIAFIFLIFNENTPIRPSQTPKNGLSSTGDIVIITSAGMLIYNTINISVDSKLIIFTILFTICTSALFLIISPTWRKHKDYISLFIIGAALFSFSAFCAVNRNFDFSVPDKHTVMIENMNYTSGKISRYDLYVEDWNENGKTISVEVNYKDYYSLEIGDYIVVEEYGGALGMKYFYFIGKAENTQINFQNLTGYDIIKL